MFNCLENNINLKINKVENLLNETEFKINNMFSSCIQDVDKVLNDLKNNELLNNLSDTSSNSSSDSINISLNNKLKKINNYINEDFDRYLDEDEDENRYKYKNKNKNSDEYSDEYSDENSDENYSEYSDEYSDDDSDDNYCYKYGFIKEKEEDDKKTEMIKDDYQNILTLSFDEGTNKKIETINKNFNLLLNKNFTYQETVIFHSIFNYNTNVLTTRNTNYKEVPLIVYILSLFDIIPTTQIFKYLFIYPFKINSKHYLSFVEEIKKIFSFDEFCKNNCLTNYTNEENIPLTLQIKSYSNSYILLLKNIIIFKRKELITNYKLEENDFKIFEEKINLSYPFLKGKDIEAISSFFNYKSKSICYDNFINNVLIKGENPTLISLDSRIHESVIILMKLIIVYNETKNFLLQNKIKTFLLWNINNPIINFIITNKIFIATIKFILKELKNYTYTKRLQILYKKMKIKI